MIPGATCDNCVFFSPHPTIAGKGQCRAEAPKLSFSGEGVKTIWPHVKNHDWCGRHSVLDGHDG